MTETIIVVGAGGHAKVVVAILQAAGRGRLLVFDDDSETWGTKLLGVPILGSIASITRAAEEIPEAAIVAVGDNRLRANLASMLDLAWTTATHPSAIVHPSVSIGPGSVVCAGAIIQPGTLIGHHVIVNTAASVDHDCELGDFVHVAPGARIAGGVHIGAGTLIGIGSSIVPEVAAGKWVTVGAGATVTGDLPDGCTAVGVPARILEASS
ncbi:MAG: acetyltransferase [Acidobacteria bacterium]|nr:acetyltransferase [Acidobacteriota bacterium]